MHLMIPCIKQNQRNTYSEFRVLKTCHFRVKNGSLNPNMIFFRKSKNIGLIFLLSFFIVQNMKDVHGVDIEKKLQNFTTTSALSI